MAMKDTKDREQPKKNVICRSANIVKAVLYDHLVHQTAYNFRNYTGMWSVFQLRHYDFLKVQFWEKYTRENPIKLFNCFNLSKTPLRIPEIISLHCLRWAMFIIRRFSFSFLFHYNIVLCYALSLQFSWCFQLQHFQRAKHNTDVSFRGESKRKYSLWQGAFVIW